MIVIIVLWILGILGSVMLIVKAISKRGLRTTVRVALIAGGLLLAGTCVGGLMSLFDVLTGYVEAS